MYDTVTMQRSGRNWRVIVSNSHENSGVVYTYDNLDDAVNKVQLMGVAIEQSESKTASQSLS